MDKSIERAEMLVSQGRYEMAEEQLEQVLASQPRHPVAHLLMAICHKHQQRWRSATEHAQQAIHLAPDNSRSHLILATIFLARDRYDEADSAAQEALSLDPYDEDNYSVLASIRFQQKKWQESLDFAEKALSIDPDNPTALSIRTLALERLGKSQVAVDAARSSLQQNPDDSFAHATHGWALLNDGKHKQAQEAFREALQLDPTNDFAKQGMIQALNANNFVFRMVQKWHTSMSRLSGSVQWIVILGLFFGQMILRRLAVQYPSIEPFVIPIVVTYFGIAILLWIANPLFNTFLRFNRYGRYLLDRQQIKGSNAIAGITILGLILGLLLAISLPEERLIGFFIGIGYGMFMLLPVSATFHCNEPKAFRIMLTVSVVLGLVGLGFIGLLLVGQFNTLLLRIFFIGNLASQFLGAHLMNATFKK